MYAKWLAWVTALPWWKSAIVQAAVFAGSFAVPLGLLGGWSGLVVYGTLAFALTLPVALVRGHRTSK